MAKRSVRKKQANRIRKVLRGSPPRYINLIEYLRDRGHANTAGEARRIILVGRVKSESHVLGIIRGPNGDAKWVAPLVSAELRKTIQVLPE